MGFISSVFDRGNPSRSWAGDYAGPLVLDIGRNTLNGAGLGDPLERLAFLGPAKEWRPSLAWPDKGLGVDFAEGRIEGFLVQVSRAAGYAPENFPGTFAREGQGVELTEAAREEKIRDLLGEPYWIDRDEDEAIFFYESPGVERQVEFTPAGNLKALIVTCRPLLSGEEERRAYGVTRPWPPE